MKKTNQKPKIKASSKYKQIFRLDDDTASDPQRVDIDTIIIQKRWGTVIAYWAGEKGVRGLSFTASDFSTNILEKLPPVGQSSTDPDFIQEVSKKFNCIPPKSKGDFLTQFGFAPDEQQVAFIKSESEKIKREFEFKNDYDLCQNILSLPTKISFYQLDMKQVPRNAEKKENVEVLIKKIKELQLSLRKTPLSLKKELDELPDQLIARGYGNFIQKKDDMRGFTFSIEENLAILLNTCYFMQPEIPKDVGGRKLGSSQKHAIYWLALFYAHGTGKFPEHTWNRESSEYEGDFQEFLLYLEPILQVLKIDLGDTPGSINSKTSTVLKKKKMPLCKL